MADFHSSTHRAKWIFTPQQLCGTIQIEVDAGGSFSYPKPQSNAKDSADKHSGPKPLNVEEEQFMRVFNEDKLREVCSAFYFPNKIQVTTLVYFKRFYLQWSVMEHHPKNIMLTCVYAACKIEENHVSAEELGKGISQDHQIILNYEMTVYQSLEFDLIVSAPYHSIEGFVNDIEEFCGTNDEQTQMLKMALAALCRANEVHGLIDFENYLMSILTHQRSAHTILELTESLNAIDSWVLKFKFPTEKDMKHINRKLKSCLGHGTHDEKKREKKSKHRFVEGTAIIWAMRMDFRGFLLLETV
ncbi:hypothetical protein SLE2022_264920 [Rubroshorea leprosula]